MTNSAIRQQLRKQLSELSPDVNVGQRIFFARAISGWDQSMLARKAKISGGVSTISSYESGKVQPPTDVVERIAFSMNVAPDLLMVNYTTVTPPRSSNIPPFTTTDRKLETLSRRVDALVAINERLISITETALRK